MYTVDRAVQLRFPRVLFSPKKVVQVILLLEREKHSMEDRTRWSNGSFLLSLSIHRGIPEAHWCATR
jgi:predicted component of type VI protein secretion system